MLSATSPTTRTRPPTGSSSATTNTPGAAAKAALDAYQDRVRLELPDFWQPSPGTLVTVQSNLHGFVPNAYGFISPRGVVFHEGLSQAAGWNGGLDRT